LSIAADVLLNLGIRFADDARTKISKVADNLLERKVALTKEHRNNFEEFIALNAAEAEIIFHMLRQVRKELVVDKYDADISILKCNTTLTAGCPPSEERIREGKLMDRDLFFFRGDWEKFHELQFKVDDISERPFDVARRFLGKIPEISTMKEVLTSAIRSPALPLQSLMWKFKYDIVNQRRSSDDLLAWIKRSEVHQRLASWPPWPSGVA
jgi:hypothetical protein